ncbi:MAG: TauD/TfdA family dioxygenase [Proteobacteria bacterium]|nr:TauD/TfdA family dioxygenase [Pseudomonadota bacterium]HQR03294.1 TauD/TfdA family dioxygenase [Rhodocyclaceae bacterium]
MTIRISPLSPVLGAEIEGLDITRPLAGPALETLEQALAEHQVLVIPAAGLEVEQHLALARQFGTLETHTFFPNLGPGYEEVSVLDSVGGTRADSWHADETFLPRPLKATFLHARILPASGGDTCWTSMSAAYAGLSAPMQRYLEGMTALHDCAKTVEAGLQWGAATLSQYITALGQNLRREQPVVITHPRTGRRALFVNPTYTRHIVGVPPEESAAVLQYLYAHQTQVRFMYRHRWRAGDLVIWDNLHTQHHAVFDYPGQRRCMYRVSVLGDRPLA